jgi:hypothetical protein
MKIALTIAALNDLDIFACDIQNAFLTAPCRARLYTVAGPEFGSDEGKTIIVVRVPTRNNVPLYEKLVFFSLVSVRKLTSLYMGRLLLKPYFLTHGGAMWTEKSLFILLLSSARGNRRHL